MSLLRTTAADLRSIVRRGPGVAAGVLGAALHPRRTLHEGTELVRGLLTPPEPTTPSRGVTPIEEAAETAPGPAPSAPVPFDLSDEPVEADDDAVIQPRGPAPHLPPSIAAEVERDYGDDLPGIIDGE
jgi:hypothetical protein